MLFITFVIGAFAFNPAQEASKKDCNKTEKSGCPNGGKGCTKAEKTETPKASDTKATPKK